MRISILFLIFCTAIQGKKISKKENEDIQAKCDSTHSPSHLRAKRVLYGEKVTKNSLEYVVNVQIGMDEGAARCSGTIISARHVISAAHCFSDKNMCNNKTSETTKLFPPKRTFVMFGGNCIVVNPHSGNCAQGLLNRKVEAVKVVVPARYGESGCNAGDIAIVELAEDVLKDGNGTETACLPIPKQPLPERVFAAGYGSDPNDPSAPQKYKEKAEFKMEKYCDYSLKAPKDSICTEEEKSFLCRGDSGSGIMHTVPDGHKLVFGVHSRGIICSVAQPFVDNPIPGRRFRGSINTDVRRYLKWICGNTGVCAPGVDRKTKVKKLTSVVFDNSKS